MRARRVCRHRNRKPQRRVFSSTLQCVWHWRRCCWAQFGVSFDPFGPACWGESCRGDALSARHRLRDQAVARPQRCGDQRGGAPPDEARGRHVQRRVRRRAARTVARTVPRHAADVDQAACGDALSWWRPFTVLSVPSDMPLAAQRRVLCALAAGLDACLAHDGAALAPRCTVSTDRRTCAAVLRAPRRRCARCCSTSATAARLWPWHVARRAGQHRAPARS